MLPAASSSSSQRAKPQRVLACLLCQQRKVRCDRKFPCANCVKARAQCVPATMAPRRRRRRFPERDLLERLRKYESLLRQHNIAFEPLHKDSGREEESTNFDAEIDCDSPDGHSESMGPEVLTPSTTLKSEEGFEAKNIWHAMSQGFRDPENDSESSQDDIREGIMKKAWEQSTEDSDHLLFGSRKAAVDISSLHPDPVQIFRLWQVYLDNVNPLLKVTHTPSLQGRIIQAASNLMSIDHNLEALMFSIYCMSIMSLDVEGCQAMFGTSRQDLLTKYQFGCQQALLNCGFLRTADRDCLTALYLYLISIKPNTVPPSLSSMLGIAIRIAQRMGIHDESTLAKCTVVEAEMRRRLWWSLMLFDTRIGELASSTTLTLNPTWDCRTPLNVNDSDLRLDMKEPPAVQARPTEILFATVRCEIGDFMRHTTFYLDFSNPALKPIARQFHDDLNTEDGELIKLETTIEEQYFKFCDRENPIHFMTMWSTRAYLAKCRLLEYHARHSLTNARQTETQRNAATSYAIRALECDTMIMTSPLTKGFLWSNKAYFPFPAYAQVVQDLRRRPPTSEQARRAWVVMGENYEAWIGDQNKDDNPVFRVFTNIILKTWEACEMTARKSGTTLTPPRMVLMIRHTLTRMAGSTNNDTTEESNNDMGLWAGELPSSTSIPVGSLDTNVPYDMGMPNDFPGTGSDMYSGVAMLSQTLSETGSADQVDWLTSSGGPFWGGY